MSYTEFYTQLGKLLYSVADIDGVITLKEKRKLYDIVVKELIPLEKHKDEYGTPVPYYAGIEFDYLIHEKTDAESAFISFTEYMEGHQSAFDDKMKKVCMHVVKELANAYQKTNKKEKTLIYELKKRIQNLGKKEKTS